MKYPNIVKAMTAAAWEILPAKLSEISAWISFKSRGGVVELGEPIQRVEASRKLRQVKGRVAILPLLGTISQRADMLEESSGGTSTERFAAEFESMLQDESIGAIVLDVDSPGGIVPGVQELGDKIFAGRERKPIIAVANGMMASAAFHVGTAASQVFVTPSGEVGSVGVLSMHLDESKALEQEGVTVTLLSSAPFKAEGNPFEPLPDDAREFELSRLREIHAQFVADLARNRGVSRAVVEADFGQGRVFGARAAVAAGMADGIKTLDQVVTELGGDLARKARTAFRKQVAALASSRKWGENPPEPVELRPEPTPPPPRPLTTASAAV